MPWVSLECAEIDPLWENGIPKAMLIFKSGFGIEAANQLLDAHRWCFLPGEGRLHGEVNAHDFHERGADRHHSSRRSDSDP